MIEQIFDWYREQFTQNETFQGLIGTVAISGVLYSLKEVPIKVFELIYKYTTVRITFTTDDWTMFDVVTQWLHNNKKHMSNIRHFRITSENMYASTEGDVTLKGAISPDTGTHWFVRDYTLFIINRTTEDSQSQNFKETISITTLSWNHSALYNLLDEMLKGYFEQSDSIRISLWNKFGHWDSARKRAKRSLDSIFLKKGQKERIVKDICNFYENEAWYIKTGVPYRRGYIFHGQPGTGKSSLILALASQVGKPVYIIPANDCKSDGELIKAFNTVPNDSIIVLEDVDAMFAARDRKNKNEDKEIHGLTTSGLLNAVDGISGSHGRLFFVTTNHIDKLDPAFFRKGRCDVNEKLEYADKEIAVNMIEYMIGKEHVESICNNLTFPCPQSDIQNEIIKNVNDLSLHDK